MCEKAISGFIKSLIKKNRQNPTKMETCFIFFHIFSAIVKNQVRHLKSFLISNGYFRLINASPYRSLKIAFNGLWIILFPKVSSSFGKISHRWLCGWIIFEFSALWSSFKNNKYITKKCKEYSESVCSFFRITVA